DHLARRGRVDWRVPRLRRTVGHHPDTGESRANPGAVVGAATDGRAAGHTGDDEMSADDAGRESRARRSYGGRRALVGLLLIAAVSTFWWRSYRHCDLLALFGPGGKAGGIVFLRGQIWVIISNIEMAEPWTAQTASA